MPEAIAARLIGSLFVERGLVSESQIRVALEIQRESGEQLGKILVEQFNVPRKELTRVVAEQWREVYGDGVGPDAGPGETWRPLGEIFLTRGFVSEDELDEALRRQRQTGERLGEALVALGVISKFELAGALGEQMATLQKAAEEEAALEAQALENNVVSLAQRMLETETSRGTEAEVRSIDIDEPLTDAAPVEAVATDETSPETEVQESYFLESDEASEATQAGLVEVSPVEPELSLEEPELAFEAPELAFEEPELSFEAPELAFEKPELSLEEPAEFELSAAPETPDQHEHLVADAEPALEPELPEPELSSIEPNAEPALEPEFSEPELSSLEANAEPALEPEFSDFEPVVSVDSEEVVESVEVVVGEPPIADWAAEADLTGLAAAVCLAYASTPRGYRLVELPVELPHVGDTIELPDVGQVVVTRVGRSPLPQDRRVCVYVDQPFVRAALEHA